MTTDRGTVRLVVIILGAVVLAIVIGAIVLTANDKPVPDSLISMGGVALGGVAALLAQTSTVKAQPLEPAAPAPAKVADDVLPTGDYHGGLATGGELAP